MEVVDEPLGDGLVDAVTDMLDVADGVVDGVVDGLAGFGVAFELLGLSSHSDNSHKESKKSGEQLGHFASTIR